MSSCIKEKEIEVLRLQRASVGSSQLHEKEQAIDTQMFVGHIETVDHRKKSNNHFARFSLSTLPSSYYAKVIFPGTSFSV